MGIWVAEYPRVHERLPMYGIVESCRRTYGLINHDPAHQRTLSGSISDVTPTHAREAVTMIKAKSLQTNDAVSRGLLRGNQYPREVWSCGESNAHLHREAEDLALMETHRPRVCCRTNAIHRLNQFEFSFSLIYIVVADAQAKYRSRTASWD